MANKKTDTKFTIWQLRQHCKELFGVSSAHFDGATHNLTGEYTKEEMKEIISDWSNRKVNESKKEE